MKRIFIVIPVLLLAVAAVGWSWHATQTSDDEGTLRETELNAGVRMPYVSNKSRSAAKQSSDQPLPSIEELAAMVTKAQIEEASINPDYLELALRALVYGTNDTEFVQAFYLLREQSRVDQSLCYETVFEDGSSAQNCPEPTSHPYLYFSNYDLKQLVSQDADANQILGQRLLYTEPTAAEQYFIQAAKLSGKPGPLIDLLNNGSYLSFDPTNGKLSNVEKSLRALTLAAAIDDIGYAFYLKNDFESELKKSGVANGAIQAAKDDYINILSPRNSQ